MDEASESGETRYFSRKSTTPTTECSFCPGPAKEQALLDLARSFHPYLMKYLAMICRGHVPTWQGKVNQDAKNFIRYFLPKGTRLDRATIGKSMRHLHLAFKGMETEEVYDVLMEQFLRAAAKYDPLYIRKVEQVVEVIENALSRFVVFHAADADRHLEFDCHRYLRLLCRRGFLTTERQPGEKRAVYRRTGTWPPPAEFFRERVRITDHLPPRLAFLPLGPDWYRAVGPLN